MRCVKCGDDTDSPRDLARHAETAHRVPVAKWEASGDPNAPRVVKLSESKRVYERYDGGLCLSWRGDNWSTGMSVDLKPAEEAALLDLLRQRESKKGAAS